MKATSPLVFGTRGSALARYQTALVAAGLQNIFADLVIQTITFSTQGDNELHKPLPEIGGKGLFTAELEAALHSKTIDLAVHSLKDLPIEDSPGLTIGAVLPRENPADVLVSRQGYKLDTLPSSAAVGTSSLRRRAQLLAYRPDVNIIPLRGNVDTRVKKAMDADGPYDAIILAAAGLKRVGLAEHISQQLPFDLMLPAPGQGAIVAQCRANDEATLTKLAQLNHPASQQAVLAEREFLAALGSGCSIPVGALGQIHDETLTLQGIIAAPDGRQVIRVSHTGPATEAESAGRALAQRALAQGARDILEVARA
jgi:hydroxymethylbilane synthase